jgi:hypothetical protein
MAITFEVESGLARMSPQRAGVILGSITEWRDGLSKAVDRVKSGASNPAVIGCIDGKMATITQEQEAAGWSRQQCHHASREKHNHGIEQQGSARVRLTLCAGWPETAFQLIREPGEHPNQQKNRQQS